MRPETVLKPSRNNPKQRNVTVCYGSVTLYDTGTYELFRYAALRRIVPWDYWDGSWADSGRVKEGVKEGVNLR